MTTVTPDEMRRLAFIKYLYGLAVEQSRHPQPMKAASVLTFHDAVELFLELATEHHRVGKWNTKFHEYFEQLERVTSILSVPWKAQMLRLNGARVDLKHHSNRPDELTIEEFRNSTTGFFSDATPIIFGKDFSDISMVDLIRYPGVRTSLDAAKKQWGARGQDTRLAMIHLASAMHELLEEQENDSPTKGKVRPYFMGKLVKTYEQENDVDDDLDDEAWEHYLQQQIEEHERDEEGTGDDVNTEVQLQEVKELRVALRIIRTELDDIKRALAVVTLGLDYRRYARFHLLTPHPDRYERSPDGSVGLLFGGVRGDCTEAEFQFCYDFVIESALRLQELDFEMK